MCVVFQVRVVISNARHEKNKEKRSFILSCFTTPLARHAIVTGCGLQCFLARHPKIVAFGACKGIKAKA